MARRKQPLTKDLIRKYFGRYARVGVRWFGDGYKVTTPTGEVLVSQNGVTVLIGGDDMYRAATLLMHDLWGGFTAYGSRESIIVWMAHGEALGVNVRPGIKRGWFGRFFLACWFFFGLMKMTDGATSTGAAIAFVAVCLWLIASRSHKRQERQLAAEVGYRFPRVHGMTGAAHDEDLDREGWL